MTGLSNGHLYSLDMMKSVAAIFITNSHFQPLYEGGTLPLLSFVYYGYKGMVYCMPITLCLNANRNAMEQMIRRK